jgi:hypothetical protein
MACPWACPCDSLRFTFAAFKLFMPAACIAAIVDTQPANYDCRSDADSISASAILPRNADAECAQPNYLPGSF